MQLNSTQRPFRWKEIDAWTILAGLAEVTERIRIGTLVFPSACATRSCSPPGSRHGPMPVRTS